MILIYYLCIRPIAVDCTLRHLVAKVTGFMIVEDMDTLWALQQMEYGVKDGAETAVHAARKFLSCMDTEHAMVKLDFRNAFNSIRWDYMLEAVCDLALTIYPFIHRVFVSLSPEVSGVTSPSHQLKEYSRLTTSGLFCSV